MTNSLEILHTTLKVGDNTVFSSIYIITDPVVNFVFVNIKQTLIKLNVKIGDIIAF